MQSSLPRTGMPMWMKHPHMRPAGNEVEQRRLSLLAWETVELWGPPEESVWTRISAEWLARHRWQVALTPDSMPRNMTSLPDAIRSLGHRDVLATQVDASLRQPSTVYRIPLDIADMEHFRQAHSGLATVFFTEHRDFLILSDGDESIVYAGARAFIHAGIQSLLEPDSEDGAYEPFSDISAMNQEVLEEMRAALSLSGRGRFYALGFEQHYRPFLA